ncbi:hypothetical protein [Burkholderia cenocepacia]|uniref:hypothetical protein n=1 Tax=Burkholderia cenocepacia TaxID=95486 RepID=UPI003D277240
MTISLQVSGDGLRIDQIKGKQNRHPVRRYADDVRQFLRALAPRASVTPIARAWASCSSRMHRARPRRPGPSSPTCARPTIC